MPAERLKVIRSNALDSATFNYKNLDVGMTRHAASAFVAVGALGWACIRFKLNAGYIVLFLLSFLIVASSWMAYFTLRRLKFQLGHTNNVFAGQPAIYNVTVQAPKRGGIRRNIDLFLGQTHQRTTLNPGESATLTLLGGLIGMAIAWGFGNLLTIITMMTKWPREGGLAAPFPVGAAIGSMVFSALIGVVFGFFPARRAARLDPIEALRHE